MPPTAAEVARTLATGRLPGRISLPTLATDIPVAHATTTRGQVLIAARRDSRAWLSLMVNGDDATAVLTIADVPPFPDSPRLGTVHVGGWVSRLGDSEVHSAGLQFAECNPLDDLLDLTAGVDLFRLEPGEVHLKRYNDTITLDPDEFIQATPDPLHPNERALLQDLRDYHLTELARLVLASENSCRPVRLDRHGLVLAMPHLHRIEFPHPANGPCCVARALRLGQTCDS